MHGLNPEPPRRSLRVQLACQRKARGARLGHDDDEDGQTRQQGTAMSLTRGSAFNMEGVTAPARAPQSSGSAAHHLPAVPRPLTMNSPMNRRRRLTTERIGTLAAAPRHLPPSGTATSVGPVDVSADNASSSHAYAPCVRASTDTDTDSAGESMMGPDLGMKDMHDAAAARAAAPPAPQLVGLASAVTRASAAEGSVTVTIGKRMRGEVAALDESILSDTADSHEGESGEGSDESNHGSQHDVPVRRRVRIRRVQTYKPDIVIPPDTQPGELERGSLQRFLELQP